MAIEWLFSNVNHVSTWLCYDSQCEFSRDSVHSRFPKFIHALATWCFSIIFVQKIIIPNWNGIFVKTFSGNSQRIIIAEILDIGMCVLLFLFRFHENNSVLNSDVLANVHSAVRIFDMKRKKRELMCEKEFSAFPSSDIVPNATSFHSSAVMIYAIYYVFSRSFSLSVLWLKIAFVS